MKISHSIVEAAYTFLVETPPFNKWNMPSEDEIKIVLFRSPTMHGYCTTGRDIKKPIIGISAHVQSMSLLLRTLTHEMIHLHMARSGMDTKGEHNAAFYLLVKKAAREQGFEPLEI
jgi:hypothetical protein